MVEKVHLSNQIKLFAVAYCCKTRSQIMGEETKKWEIFSLASIRSANTSEGSMSGGASIKCSSFGNFFFFSIHHPCGEGLTKDYVDKGDEEGEMMNFYSSDDSEDSTLNDKDDDYANDGNNNDNNGNQNVRNIDVPPSSIGSAENDRPLPESVHRLKVMAAFKNETLFFVLAKTTGFSGLPGLKNGSIIQFFVRVRIDLWCSRCLDTGKRLTILKFEIMIFRPLMRTTPQDHEKDDPDHKYWITLLKLIPITDKICH
ncbi:hypothetical protein ACFE04_019834 [Oxalis oulophora]